MKILQVIPSLIKGGAERLVLDITKALVRVPDIQVRLVYFNNINDYAEEYSDVNAELLNIHVMPSILGSWSVNLDQWNTILDDFKPDVIHSHLFAADLLTRHNVRNGVRYFSHCHDNMYQLRSFKTDSSLKKSRLTDLYERRFVIDRYRKSRNTFISISPDTTDYFKRNLPRDLASRIVELPNAINVAKFKDKEAQPPMSGMPLRILNVGSFVPKKNQSLLIDIAAILRKENLNFEIRFAGDGPELKAIQRKAVELGVSENVMFLGNVEHVEVEMWNSHIYVHTAKYEPFGLVLLEAMAAGLPVITLDGRGNRKLITDKVNGFFIEQERPETFAKKIIELCNDPELWNRFSSEGKQFSQRFDIHPYVEKLIQLYANLK